MLNDIKRSKDYIRTKKSILEDVLKQFPICNRDINKLEKHIKDEIDFLEDLIKKGIK